MFQLGRVVQQRIGDAKEPTYPSEKLKTELKGWLEWDASRSGETSRGKAEGRTKGWDAPFIGWALGAEAAALFFDGSCFPVKQELRSSASGGT